MQHEVYACSPVKSPNDKREYKVTLLDNGLRLLMIRDPEAKKSACAISVRVGSLTDPDSSLGLAHFLEHMLFMGSARYPVQNEYS
jgi:secreted Zn-dependent insulinase-like peptidase